MAIRTCSEEPGWPCVVKRFVSSILFVAAVALLACTIFSKQDTKSTPTEPNIEGINNKLCLAGLGGGPDCNKDDDSTQEDTCPGGELIDGKCCSTSLITNDGLTCCPSAQQLTKDKQKCCPSGQHAKGNDCVPETIVCKNGKIINDECCPSDRVNGDTCCESGQIVEGGICVPKPIEPKPIECPTGTSKDKDNQCCPNERFITTKKNCCPVGSKNDNSKCECNDDNKVYNSTSNTCVPKPEATSKLQHTTLLWALLGIIALICIFLLVLFFTRSNDKAVQGVVGPQGSDKEVPENDDRAEYQFERQEEDY